MNLFEEVEREARGGRGVQCPVHKALSEMDAGVAEQLRTLLSGSYQSAPIQRVLRRHGFVMGEGAVATHRRGACSCRFAS